MSVFLDCDKSVNCFILGNLSNESLDVPDLQTEVWCFACWNACTRQNELTPYFGTKLQNPSTRREKRSTSRGHFWRLGRQYARWLRSYLYFVVLRQQIIPVLMTYVSKIIIRRVRAALCLNRVLLSHKLCLDSIRFGLVFSLKIADPVWVAQVSTRHLSVISSQ